MPLTEEQRNALPALRAIYTSTKVDFGHAMPFDERARLPETGIPDDIAARVEIAPPLSTPLPLINAQVLKRPERVPVFFYSLSNRRPGPNGPQDTKVIFYVHGGGNLHSHPTDVHYINLFAQVLRAFTATAGNSVACVIVAPCYRLATVEENTFPAAVQDVMAAYDDVIGRGYRPSNITVTGDSAGGNTVLVLTHLALHSGRPLPDGVVVIAPASKHTYDDLSEHAKAQADTDLLTREMYHFGAVAYVGKTGFAITDPLVSGSLITFTEAWPKTLIMVGTGDQLIDASKELEKRLKALDRPVELVEYDERPHGWWLELPSFPEEVRDASERIVRFILG